MRDRLRLVLCVAAATLIFGVTPAQAAEETPVVCGQVVTGTIKLANDLHCVETDGLIVGSDDTIIDFNGHEITCTGVGYEGSCQGTAVASAPDEEPEDGVSIHGHTNVHVVDTKKKNGDETTAELVNLDGFDNGVDIDRSHDVKVEHLVVTGPPATLVNPRPFSHGVRVRGSSCVGEDGGNIHIGTGQTSGNDLSHANQGVAINGSCVSVVHNRVHHNNSNGSVPSNGILINAGSSNVVRGNEVFENGDAVDSTEQDGGITLRNRANGNHVTNNEVTENFGDGISVRTESFNNKIDNNLMLLNGGAGAGTLFYDAAGRDAPGGPPGSEPLNEWNQNNRCLTQNEEVPPGTCEPDDVPPGEG